MTLKSSLIKITFNFDRVFDKQPLAQCCLWRYIFALWLHLLGGHGKFKTVNHIQRFTLIQCLFNINSLALAWFLAAGLKWGHEAIESRSHLFHLVAWAIPAIQTIFVLAMGKVEGDVLSGVCFVGQLDSESLLIFLIVPLCTYLSIGALFIIAGFFSLFRIRTVMKHDGNRTDKLERLMLRIGFFSTLFILPSFVYCGCLIYEYINFDTWMTNWHRSMCIIFQIPCPHPSTNHSEDDKPIFHIYMLKYVSSMLVGITSSVWLWSNKTVTSWKMFIERLKGRDSSRDLAYV